MARSLKRVTAPVATIARYPTLSSSVDETFQRALAALRAGKAQAAEHLFRKLLRVRPKHVAGLNLLGVLLSQQKRWQEAEPFVRRALRENSKSDATHYNYGIILKNLHRPAEALERFNQALTINPSVAETWNNRGAVFNDLKRFSEALADFDKAIAIQPNYAEAYYNKGNSFANLRRHDEALRAYDNALQLEPSLARAWVGRATILTFLREHAEAKSALDRALTLDPHLAAAWLALGNLRYELRQHREAHEHYAKALALEPDLAEAWYGQGNVHSELRQYDLALTAYDKAFALNPDLPFLDGARLNAKLQVCDWSDLDEQRSRFISRIRDGRPAGVPLAMLPLSNSARDHFRCAVCNAAAQPTFPPLWRGETYNHDRIRVAYLSSDFRNHPVATQIAGLFESHDRTRFDVTALSSGFDDHSETRARIKNSVARFLDVAAQSDGDVASAIHSSEIDILIDLNGFTAGGRTNIFARRPAPIQVNFLGYAGTMGAAYFDYIVADQIVIPERDFEFFSESVVWLPGSFLVTDCRRKIAERTPSRAACGLPENAFVFCCFNNIHKIVPEVFDIWMKLLKAVDGSVLWLSNANLAARGHLFQEAERRGVSPGRLIFAPRVEAPDHLARHRQADLFLDTFPYNAHSTASDALWAGLPVLTCLGSTFAGRVAASLLRAVGLPELITDSLAEYEALALKLAQDSPSLQALKTRLAQNRTICPLFNTDRFARQIEAAYTMMWNRHRARQRPEPFVVEPIG
jgi:predicted O-linked N-acetylglucosamine transferase (SPINDLY family)